MAFLQKLVVRPIYFFNNIVLSLVLDICAKFKINLTVLSVVEKAMCILVASKHFWTAILGGAVEGGKERVRAHERRRAEIDELHVKLVVYDHVLVFDVAVKDVQRMQVLHCLPNLERNG